MNNETMNQKARRVVEAMAKGSSLNAVSRLVGVPQPTLYRFVTDKDTSLSLKNFEKLAPYIESAQRALGE